MLPALAHGDAHARRLVTGRSDRVFFTGMAIAAALAVLVGFSPTFYLRSRSGLGPLPTYLIVHGVAFTSWIVLFIAQTTLVAVRRVRWHRMLGWAMAALAAAMVAVGCAAGILSMRGQVAAGNVDEARTFLTTPLLSMVTFGCLVGAAVAWRRRVDVHKRLMLLATLSILDAAVARWPLAVVATDLGGYFVTNLFVAVAVTYDVVAYRRISVAYRWAVPLILFEEWMRGVIGQTAAWHEVARQIIG